MTAADYSSLVITCHGGPAPCQTVSPTQTTAAAATAANNHTSLQATATYQFTAPGTYIVTFTATVATGAPSSATAKEDTVGPYSSTVQQDSSQTVVVRASPVVARAVSWQSGTRLPFAAFHPDRPPWKGSPRDTSMPGLFYVPQLQVCMPLSIPYVAKFMMFHWQLPLH